MSCMNFQTDYSDILCSTSPKSARILDEMISCLAYLFDDRHFVSAPPAPQNICIVLRSFYLLTFYNVLTIFEASVCFERHFSLS